MFSKRPEPAPPEFKSQTPSQEDDQEPTTSAPHEDFPRASAQEGSGSYSHSVISEELTIEGNVVSKGPVQINARIDGSVRGTSLIVGESARIAGDITAEDIVVSGQVSGDIRGARVALNANARVVGDIHHRTLSIEHGAVFEGLARRADRPAKQPAARDTQSAGAQSGKSGTTGKEAASATPEQARQGGRRRRAASGQQASESVN